MMTPNEKSEILDKAEDWFENSLVKRHLANTLKLENAKEFSVNPFLALYLANFLGGDSTSLSVAKGLIYARALGTSVTTTFGNAMQKFTSEVLGAYGSAIAGIDLEFEDQIDGRHKYCQLKLGPNTINKDDVETIAGHFNEVHRRARINHLNVAQTDLIVGTTYGENNDLSGHYRRLTSQYNIVVYAGSEFWRRLTGDEDFFDDLVGRIRSVASKTNFAKELDEVISKLAKTEEIVEISG